MGRVNALDLDWKDWIMILLASRESGHHVRIMSDVPSTMGNIQLLGNYSSSLVHKSPYYNEGVTKVLSNIMGSKVAQMVNFAIQYVTHLGISPN